MRRPCYQYLTFLTVGSALLFAWLASPAAATPEDGVAAIDKLVRTIKDLTNGQLLIGIPPVALAGFQSIKLLTVSVWPDPVHKLPVCLKLCV